MLLGRIIAAVLITALAVALTVGPIWGLAFGGRLLYLLYRRHRELWRSFGFRLGARGPYSRRFYDWLRLRQFEQLDDPATVKVARALLDARPVLVLMAIASVIAATYAVTRAFKLHLTIGWSGRER